jgi:hypothetical protein
VQLAVWAAIAAGFYLYARTLGATGGAHVAVSIAIGLIATMALLVADSAFRTAQESRLLRRAASGAPPRDGTWSAASGELRTAAPLRAPLSGEAVAMYEYSISRDQRVGRTTSLLTYFDGKALAASSIGTVRLLSVPKMEVEPVHVDTSRALSNARDYVRRASFEQRDTARQRTAALEREWTDDDGVYRIDRRYSAPDVELDEGFRFEERHLKPRDVVCAFGVYSSARNGLVPDERWGRPARIMSGAAGDVARQLRGRVIRYVLLAIVLAALAAGGSMLFLREVSAVTPATTPAAGSARRRSRSGR